MASLLFPPTPFGSLYGLWPSLQAKLFCTSRYTARKLLANIFKFPESFDGLAPFKFLCVLRLLPLHGWAGSGWPNLVLGPSPLRPKGLQHRCLWTIPGSYAICNAPVWKYVF
jgi:hypothetical protein